LGGFLEGTYKYRLLRRTVVRKSRRQEGGVNYKLRSFMNLYSSANVIGGSKSREMELQGYVLHFGKANA
jgi:hypothetical protein